MKPKTGAMIGMFASHGLLGLLAVWSPVASPHGDPLALVPVALVGFLVGFFPFAWVIHDRRERGLPRSGRFNVALVSLTALVVPIYLWRNRPRGERLAPLLGMAGVTLGLHVMVAMGLIAGLLLIALTMDLPGV